jgi:hypothetical protein
MNPMCVKTLILVTALGALPGFLQSQPPSASATQTAAPASSQPQSNPPAKPKKKPDEPIDPDATAGVRGNGSTHTVRVLLKGKPAVGAHVVVKNTDGTLAASCYTSDSGECQADVGVDKYIISATTKGRAGTVSISVGDSPGPIVIKLTKVKTETSAPNP